MRELFTGHFPLSEDERDEVWETATFTFDANVLLNLYRLQIDTRESMLESLAALANRLWLSYQVAHEFHTHRVQVIREQQQLVTELLKKLGSIRGTVQSQLSAHARNPVIDVRRLRADLEAAVKKCETYIEGEKAAALTRFGVTPQSDPVLERLGTLLQGRVGEPFDEGKMGDLVAEGDRRIQAKIPPGYSDHKKPSPERYGDFFLWRQVLDEFVANPRNLILVTDDEKDDWWLESAGETLGGRPELFQEFNRETGRHLLMYTTSSFLGEAGRRGIVTVRPESVEDAADLLAEDERERKAQRLDDFERDITMAALRKSIRRADEEIAAASAELARIDSALSSRSKSGTPASITHRLQKIQDEELFLLQAASRAEDTAEVEKLLEQVRLLAERRKRFEAVVGTSHADASADRSRLLMLKRRESVLSDIDNLEASRDATVGELRRISNDC